MQSSREGQLQTTIDRLALELAQERAAHRMTAQELTRERAAHRRTAEELDWRDETIRVLRRVIERLGKDRPEAP